MWVNRNVKRQVTKWEKISENSYSKHTNNKNKSIRKDKIGMQFYNWLKNLNRYFTDENIQMDNKYI